MIRFRYIYLLLILISCSLGARERRALAIGIGQYEDKAWVRISADGDLSYVVKILEEHRFKDVAILKNEQATKDAIVKEFEGLIDRSGRGDVVYIHFSGHGQQVKDLDGDEEDGYDESWIPYDAYRKCCVKDDGSRHFIDDEINDLLDRLRRKVGEDGNILVVVDACHSGGSSRGGTEYEGYVSRGVNDVFVPSVRMSGRNVVKETWIEISACEDYQMNFEVRKPKVGKLTYCLYKLRKRLALMTDEELLDELTDMMDSPEMMAPMPQNPYLGEGKERYDVKDAFIR